MSGFRDPDAADALDRMADQDGRRLGLTHAQVMAEKVKPASQLVADLIERGTPGTIAGLPETFKSWIALQTTVAVACGGSLLDRQVLHTGPAGYWWQDDSHENEVRRIQAYAHRHDATGDLSIRWHLNEGLVLPDDIDALRAEVESEKQVLVVLDSLYNFLRGIKLKDEDVATVIAALKAEVCDPTGCALMFVDHSPWPTEGNQGQRRGYGSVFKAAAIRWGIYLDRAGDAIFVEARGNNLTGLTRTAAMWDADALELRLVHAPSETDDLAGRIEDFLRRNPGATTKVVQAGVTGGDTLVRQRLDSDERFTNVPPVMFGRPKNALCWARAIDVPNLINATSASGGADVVRTLPPGQAPSSARRSSPPVGGRADADVESHVRQNSQRTSADDAAQRLYGELLNGGVEEREARRIAGAMHPHDDADDESAGRSTT
jgi:hypothetical protein